MLTRISREPEGRAGALTDGTSWTFYFLRESISEDEETTGYELHMSKPIKTETDEGIAIVMGIYPVQLF